jgi:REP element-mobilizing transposase RayT
VHEEGRFCHVVSPLAKLDQVSQFFLVYVGFYAFMGNHFHLLFEMLGTEHLKDPEIQARYEIYYAKAIASGRHQIPDWKRPEVVAAIRKRMSSPSEFMHDLKGQFAAEYNVRHDRRGSFWEGRFGHTLLDETAVARCARYVELNPLRAQLEEKVGAAGRNSWHDFEKSCDKRERDFRKHPGFRILLRSLHPDPEKPLSESEEFELAMKLHAAWREHFDAEEKRIAEEKAAAALAQTEKRLAELATSRRRSPFAAFALGTLDFCQGLAAAMGRDLEPVLIEPGLYGLFRRERRRV